MELADVTDSKSVGSNTVRVRPPPSAPKSVTPLNEWGYTFCVLVGGRTRNLRVVQGCTMAVAQSRRKDAPTQTTAIRHPAPLHFRSLNKRGIIFWCGGRENPQLAGSAGMHDGGRTKSAQGRADPNDRNSTPRPATLSLAQQAGYYFLVRREGEPAACG